jgi:hypothetical protein
VPKFEIFDRSDFHDFYTIKPFWVGDIVVKIKLVIEIFWGTTSHLISSECTEHTRKELMHMLSI